MNLKKTILGAALFVSTLFNAKAQAPARADALPDLKEKNSYDGHRFYIAWGYTRAWYSKSTINFKNESNRYNPVTGRVDNYDFTIHDATAKDRPQFNRIIKDLLNPTIPQEVIRIGYHINNKWAIELNYDHAKYVVNDYQKVRITGHFNGVPVDKDTILDPARLLHFEHTDGANFWMINAVRKFNLYQDRNLRVTWMVKPGAGVVIPRTDVTLFGQELNNNYKVAGWIAGVETGLRVSVRDRVYAEFVGKGVYADYVNAFVLGKGNGSASHHFVAGQLTASLGYQFDFKKKHAMKGPL